MGTPRFDGCFWRRDLVATAAGRQRNGLHRDPKLKGGKITRYRVKWRTGGTRDGAWDGTTFDAHTDAKQFKALVEVHGHQWPPVEVLIAKGLAYLVPGAVAVPAAPVLRSRRLS